MTWPSPVTSFRGRWLPQCVSHASRHGWPVEFFSLFGQHGKTSCGLRSIYGSCSFQFIQRNWNPCTITPFVQYCNARVSYFAASKHLVSNLVSGFALFHWQSQLDYVLVVSASFSVFASLRAWLRLRCTVLFWCDLCTGFDTFPEEHLVLIHRKWRYVGLTENIIIGKRHIGDVCADWRTRNTASLPAAKRKLN